MISLKKWNSFSEKTRKQILKIILGESYVNNVPELIQEYHHDFNYSVNGGKLKLVLGCCNEQKDGIINVTVGICPEFSEQKVEKKSKEVKSKKEPKKLISNNINEDIFKRYTPQNKLEMIRNLTTEDLKKVSKDTIIRMIKEGGKNHYKSRDKFLQISRKYRKGNDWNSCLESVELSKGKLMVDLYVQYGDCDTDTTVFESFDRFISGKEYCGEIKGSDYRGNTKFYYFTYSTVDRLECIRSIFYEYIKSKYNYEG